MVGTRPIRLPALAPADKFERNSAIDVINRGCCSSHASFVRYMLQHCLFVIRITFSTHLSSFYSIACIAANTSLNADSMSTPLVFSTGPRPGCDAWSMIDCRMRSTCSMFKFSFSLPAAAPDSIHKHSAGASKSTINLGGTTFSRAPCQRSKNNRPLRFAQPRPGKCGRLVEPEIAHRRPAPATSRANPRPAVPLAYREILTPSPRHCQPDRRKRSPGFFHQAVRQSSGPTFFRTTAGQDASFRRQSPRPRPRKARPC